MSLATLILAAVAAVLGALAFGAWRSTDALFELIIADIRRLGKESEERTTILNAEIAEIRARIEAYDKKETTK